MIGGECAGAENVASIVLERTAAGKLALVCGACRQRFAALGVWSRPGKTGCWQLQERPLYGVSD